MKINSHYNRGFIGIISLFIAVAVIAYLMAIQYQKSGLSKINTPTGKSPIDQALDARDQLEGSNRGI